MKTLKTSLKTIALFFMALTLLQSCVAYQKTPVSLRQAEQSKKRVKMKTSANQTKKGSSLKLPLAIMGIMRSFCTVKANQLGKP